MHTHTHCLYLFLEIGWFTVTVAALLEGLAPLIDSHLLVRCCCYFLPSSKLTSPHRLLLLHVFSSVGVGVYWPAPSSHFSNDEPIKWPPNLCIFVRELSTLSVLVHPYESVCVCECYLILAHQIVDVLGLAFVKCFPLLAFVCATVFVYDCSIVNQKRYKNCLLYIFALTINAHLMLSLLILILLSFCCPCTRTKCVSIYPSPISTSISLSIYV